MSKNVELELCIMRDEPTDQAILVQGLDLSDPKIWIPRSKIVDIEYLSRSTLTNPIAMITMPEWLAIEKELI